MAVNLSLKALTIILLLLCLVLVLVIIYKKRRYSPINVEYLKKSLPAFKEYLDSYYITNKIYTISIFVFFLFSTTIIFAILRYLYLGELTNLIYIESKNISFSIIFSIIVKCILFSLCLLLYKVILDILFFKEVLKVHLYLMQYNMYVRLQKALEFKILEELLEHLWVLCYRIATLTYDPDFFSKDFDIWFPQLIHSLEFNYHTTNPYIKTVALWFMELSSKYSFISYFFFFLARIFKFLSWHISNQLFKLLPYTLLLLVVFYDLSNRQLYYLYYASFIFIIARLIISYRNFVKESSSSVNRIIAKYFYKNKLPYEEQRFYILNYKTYTLKKTSRQNDNLKSFASDDPLMLLNNLKKSPILEPTSEQRLSKKRIIYMNLRFHVFLVFLTLASCLFLSKSIIIYLFNFKIPLLFLGIPLLILLYSMTKIFYRTIDQEYDGNENYQFIYNRKYDVIFWITTLIQLYIFWILLFEPTLILPDTEILFDHIIRITKIYTIEDKIMYIYNYFDYYITYTGLTIEEQELLRYKLRLIDFSTIITENTTLNDIRMNVREFIQTEYYKNTILIWESLIAMAKDLTEESPWYTFLKNILFIGAISSTVIGTIEHYTHFWSIVKQLQDPMELSRIATKIMEVYPRRMTTDSVERVVQNFGDKLKERLSDIVDIFLFDEIPLQIKIIFGGIVGISLGTFLLPSLIHSLELRFSQPLKEADITLIDDLPVISYGTQNLFTPYFYCIGALLFVFGIIICIKILCKPRKKKNAIDVNEH